MLRELIQRWPSPCKFSRLLSAYLDNELSTSDATDVATHLRDCAPCKNEWQQLSLSKRALVQFEIPVSRGQWTSEAAANSIKLTSLHKRIFQQRISIPIPLAAALLLALIAGSWFAFSSQQTTTALPQSESVKVIEVPVERVITRTVYLTRTDKSRTFRPRRTLRSSSTLDEHLARQRSTRPELSSQGLGTFRPAASANLRVVKDPDQ
jgi:Putative zinc-finger